MLYVTDATVRGGNPSRTDPIQKRKALPIYAFHYAIDNAYMLAAFLIIYGTKPEERVCVLQSLQEGENRIYCKRLFDSPIIHLFLSQLTEKDKVFFKHLGVCEAMLNFQCQDGDLEKVEYCYKGLLALNKSSHTIQMMGKYLIYSLSKIISEKQQQVQTATNSSAHCDRVLRRSAKDRCSIGRKW